MIQAFSVPLIDMRIGDARWESYGDLEALSGRALNAAAGETGEQGAVDILFTNDEEMRHLNSQWRNLDKPTDVLSFPSDGPEIPGQPRHLGDIALGLETALRDAEAMKRPFDAHVSHLLIHGFLHLVGYDHIEAEDAAVMEPLETKILGSLGWPDPYANGPYAGEKDKG
ncbi:MAG: rRNA maturation RNase YbeY [Hyphomonadaceae bacterium]|nr:rRNA maturation RNase YbeY [Hyphomonadaceae bacterium]